jgi:hypothetical protein
MQIFNYICIYIINYYLKIYVPLPILKPAIQKCVFHVCKDIIKIKIMNAYVYFEFYSYLNNCILI